LAQIVVIPNGRFGNNLFQLSLMNTLRSHCQSLVILLPSFPEMGIDESEGYSNALELEPDLRVIDHQIDLNSLITFIKENPYALIHCSAWGMYPAAYNNSRSYLRSIFVQNKTLTNENQYDLLRFHIRGGDLWQTPIYKRDRYIHPDYTGIPISFYKLILENTKMPSEFIIEKTVPTWYLRALEECVEIKPRRSKATPIQDFLTLASSKEIGLGVSTFSWMSAFIGNPSMVHLPILGIFDSTCRPELDFQNPTWNVKRYHFEKHSWTGTKKDKDWLLFSRCHLAN
jgi:hypothetical protein